MTNTGWQQSSPVRRSPIPRFFADGVYAPGESDEPGLIYNPDQVAEGGPIYNPDEIDNDPGGDAQFTQDLQDANEVGPPQVPVAGAQPYLPVDESQLPIPPFIDPSGNQHVYDPQPDAPPQAPAIATAPADPYGYAAKNAALSAELAKYPVRTPPKWWERALAGGLGGAVGYVNAAGRTRPIDVRDATEGILHPGYAEKVAEWQSRVGPLQQAAELAGKQTTAAIAGQKVNSQTQLQTAQAEAARQHGAYWASRSEQERNQWKVDPKSGTLYNTITGAVSAKPATPKDRYDTAVALHATPEQATEYALSGKITGAAPRNTNEWQVYLDAAHGDSKKALDAKRADDIRVAQASRAPRDPLVDVARQAIIDKQANDELDKVGNTKQQNEQRLHAQRTQEIDGYLKRMNIGSVQEAMQTEQGRAVIAAINQKYVPMLQNNEDNFRRNAGRRGVMADPFQVLVDPANPANIIYRPVAPPAGAPAAQPPQAAAAPPVRPPATQQPPQAAAPPKYTEDQVRAAATAKGKDPATAIAAARAKGLIQ